MFDNVIFEDKINKPKLSNIDYSTSGSSLVINTNSANYYYVDFEDRTYRNSRYKFNIVILPFQRTYFEKIINLLKVDAQNQTLMLDTFEDFSFGEGLDQQKYDIIEDNMSFNLHSSESSKFTLSEKMRIYDNVFFSIRIDNNSDFKFVLNDISSDPRTLISLFELNNLIRNKQVSFSYDSERKVLTGGDTQYSDISGNIIELLNYELYFRENCAHCIINGEAKKLDIDEDLNDAYLEFVCHLSDNKTLPSLAYFSHELSKKAGKYIDTYTRKIMEINQGSNLTHRQKDLKLLGTVLYDSVELYSPYHPLVLSHILRQNEILKSEIIKEEILTKLTPDKFVPFILNSNDDVLESHINPLTNTWLQYAPSRLYTSTEHDLYTSNLVCEKIEQFIAHFKPLFINDGTSPIIINLINITNDFDVLKGVLKFIIRDLKKKPDFQGVPPIIINLYNNSDSESSFEVISQLRSIDEIDNTFSSDILREIRKEIDNIDEQDILNVFYRKIDFYRFKGNDDYTYAHISFVNLLIDEKFIANQMTDFENGTQLNGLISSLSNASHENDFRVGFGTNFAPELKILELSTLLNELNFNLNKNGNSAYQKSNTITLRISNKQLGTLKKIYECSHWVTFINPQVDIDYFKRSSPELLVIHYADQITSFKRFDSITLTSKTNQYKHVLKNYLKDYTLKFSESQLDVAIKSFNCINGEWLLRSLKRSVSSSSQYGKEKLSLISGVKYMLAFLYTPEIMWVPISLEEIVRVAGIAKLDSLSSAFNAKSLDEPGHITDDLLFLGLRQIGDSVKVILYPVEVKIGENSNIVMKKAREQVEHFIAVLKKHIVDNQSFEGRYYLNLFVQIALSNAQMMASNDFWPENKILLSSDMKRLLARGEFEITSDLNNVIGKGAILSFKKSQIFKSLNLVDNLWIANLTERDGFEGIYKGVNDIRNPIIKNESDISSVSLLEYKYKDTGTVLQNNYINNENDFELENIEAELIIDGIEELTSIVKEQSSLTEVIPEPIKEVDQVLSETVVFESETTKMTTLEAPNKELQPTFEKSRILIGNVKNSNSKIYWEFGEKSLPNRHLLISGTSGQGKTYLIQCLVLELSRLGISSVIFDYTQGFTEDKLEQEFKDATYKVLNQQIVLYEKFPINPFIKQIIDANGEKKEESPVLVANRLTDIFSHVYNFGEQQMSALYKACKLGVEKYGVDMNMERLEQELINSDIKESKTVLSKLQPFFDMNFFSGSSNINWNEWIYNGKGKINVIQLLSIPNEMQVVLTELILWDLWYHVQKEGSEGKPFIAVMDEAQNLSFQTGSPASKILTEGRKFGWSAWFATQFIKGQIRPDGISRIQQAAQKIYFLPPDNEISDVASRISTDNNEKKQVELMLKSLEKGKCLFDGQQLTNGKLIGIKPVIIQVGSLKVREK